MNIYVPLRAMASLALNNGYRLPIQYFKDRALASGNTIIIVNGPKGDPDRCSMTFTGDDVIFKNPKVA